MHYLTDALGAIGMFATLLILGGGAYACNISAEEYERALEILRRGMARRTHEEDSGRESGKPED
jgi:hypothetical protein